MNRTRRFSHIVRTCFPLFFCWHCGWRLQKARHAAGALQTQASLGPLCLSGLPSFRLRCLGRGRPEGRTSCQQGWITRNNMVKGGKAGLLGQGILGLLAPGAAPDTTTARTQLTGFGCIWTCVVHLDFRAGIILTLPTAFPTCPPFCFIP